MPGTESQTLVEVGEQEEVNKERVCVCAQPWTRTVAWGGLSGQGLVEAGKQETMRDISNTVNKKIKLKTNKKLHTLKKKEPTNERISGTNLSPSLPLSLKINQ